MTDSHRWHHPAVLDDMFLYHLARLLAAWSCACARAATASPGACVQLTTSGHALHAELFPQIHSINLEPMSAVPPAELQALASAFAPIRAKAAEMYHQRSWPKAQRSRRNTPRS